GIADANGQPFYFIQRQMVYVVLGVGVGFSVLRVPMDYWERFAPFLLIFSFILLVLVMLPGIGRQVNGSTRWVSLGLFQLQVSELVKFFVLIYLAGYLVRRGDEVRSTVNGFLKPMAVLAVVGALLLLEPDFGAAAVLVATAMGMMYLAGVRLWQFAVLLLVTAALLASIVLFSPYRWLRVISFMDPWSDPFNSGFQLTQSLIAFGQGEWFGVGLGGSIQKLFYLPEAHTDFLFAVLSEELGLVGALSVVMLFVVLVWRAFVIASYAQKSGQHFSAYLAYGIGLLVGLQAFINIGVNMGVLPTKGLTLPLMSYGGSSMVVTCVAIAILLRIRIEAFEKVKMPGHRKTGRKRSQR
ncbi:MAG: putative lipid II flippase FtsW, partial [Gammaproteobacteria bacterium]|nr:putative lipid II flippase FtsW [Gammaproteobacteria bacterium]